MRQEPGRASIRVEAGGRVASAERGLAPAERAVDAI